MMELIPLSVHTQWEALAATLKKGGRGLVCVFKGKPDVPRLINL